MAQENGKNAKLVSWFLRIGLAFVFLYAGIAAFVEPEVWMGYLPMLIQHGAILEAFSIIEILLALSLLSGKFLRYASSLAALMLAGIIITNLSVMDIVFRDIGIFFSAVALAINE